MDKWQQIELNKLLSIQSLTVKVFTKFREIPLSPWCMSQRQSHSINGKLMELPPIIWATHRYSTAIIIVPSNYTYFGGFQLTQLRKELHFLRRLLLNFFFTVDFFKWSTSARVSNHFLYKNHTLISIPFCCVSKAQLDYKVCAHKLSISSHFVVAIESERTANFPPHHRLQTID